MTYDVRRVRINDDLKSLFSLTRLRTQSGLQPSASYDVVNEIVEIAFGTLLNKPSISFFTQICDNPSAVRRGDLFILTQKDSTQAQRDIEEAVQRGAFGILFSGNIAMNDEEVAWISVEDLEQSLMRILRHYLMMHNKILFLLDSDEYAIATQIIVPKKNLGFYLNFFRKVQNEHCRKNKNDL